MSEVIYQIGEDRKIVYKEGMRQEGLRYLRKCESFPGDMGYIWLLGLLSSFVFFIIKSLTKKVFIEVSEEDLPQLNSTEQKLIKN